jgi:uncharacterized protein (DUF302 family)
MYYFSQIVPFSFDEAVIQVTDALKTQGFGILTQIDAQAAFKQKLGIEFRRYAILGSCQPQIAYQMLGEDDKAGVLFPCNVIIQEHPDGQVEVAAVDPLMMFLLIQTPNAKALALEARQRMVAVMKHLTHPETQQV